MGQVNSDMSPRASNSTCRQKLNDDCSDHNEITETRSSDEHAVIAAKLSFHKRVAKNCSLVASTIIETENFQECRRDFDQKPIAGITESEAGFQLFKVFLGTGILLMPKAFATVGVGLGLILTILIAFITIHTFEMVIAASQHFAKLNQTNCYSFSETFRFAMEKWPALSPYAVFGRRLVTVLIIFSCYTVCMVYVLLIANNLEDLLRLSGRYVSFKIILIMEYPILIMLNSFTSLRRLTLITTMSLVSLWLGIGFTVYAISTHMVTYGPRTEKAKWEFSEIPSCLSIVVFAFNGIASLTPIVNNMKSTKKCFGYTSVVCVVVTLLVASYASYGLLGYFTFGTSTEGPVLINLPPNEIFVQILKVCISLGLFLSCSTMIFAPIMIVTEHVYDKAAVGRKMFCKVLIKWIHILFIILVPLLIQNVMTLLELLSGLNLILQFIVPVVIDTLTFTCMRQGFIKIINILRNIILFSIGLLCVNLTFYSGMVKVLKFYEVL